MCWRCVGAKRGGRGVGTGQDRGAGQGEPTVGGNHRAYGAMPRKAGRNCTRGGCAGIVRDGVCSLCGPTRRHSQREHDARRGTSAQRGYDARWRKLREAQLSREPLCARCREEGWVVAATDVDHIVPRRQGGSDSFDNFESLCHSHHSEKTARESGWAGRGAIDA